MSAKSVPTLYEWAGGMAALERLTNHFYEQMAGRDALTGANSEGKGRQRARLSAPVIAPQSLSASSGAAPRGTKPRQ
jgi:truncated hemoglobin YjbI